MDRRTMYKSRNDVIRNLDKENKRNDNNRKLQIQRKDRRTRLFNERRSISEKDNIGYKPESPNTVQTSKKDKLLARKLALQKYILEKEKMKKTSQLKKRPPFVVGIPHHGYSPILKTIETQQNKDSVCTRAQNHRITRTNSKQINREIGLVSKSAVQVFPFNERKSVFKFEINKGVHLKKLTSPHTPTVLKRSAQKPIHCTRQMKINDMKKDNNNARENVLRKVLRQKKTSSTDSGQQLGAALPNSEATDISNMHSSIQEPEVNVIGCQRLNNSTSSTESFKQQPVGDTVPNSEELGDMNESLIHNAKPTTDIDSCEVPNIPEQETSVESRIAEEFEEFNRETTFQRERVDNESDRLLCLAEEWEAIALINNIPQDIVDEIDSVVGQTRLLTKDKFNQFRRLVDQYERGQGSQKITIEDLNGFWDMVYLQVEPLIKRYTNLDVLQKNNWEEKKIEIVPHNAKRRKRNEKREVTKYLKKSILANEQPSTINVKESVQEEDHPTKTPISKKKIAQIHNTSRYSKTPHSWSSPYIVMQLSGVGRSLNTSPTVAQEVDPTTPSSIFKKEINSANSAKKMGIDTLPLETEDTVEFTPRRSMRLVGRTPQSLVKVCSSCQSPDCRLSSCKRKNEKLVKSRTKRIPMISPKPDDISNSEAIQTEENYGSNKPRQKLILRPSRLVLNDLINLPIPEKKIFCDKENSLVVEDLESSGSVRRSTRLASIRKVTFNSDTKENNNFKLPSTPYHKSGHMQELFPGFPCD